MVDRFAVLEGDWGGQVYLVANVRLLDLTKIMEVLAELDEIAWLCNGGRGRSFRIMQFSPLGVEGGMRGGEMVCGGVWMDDEFQYIEGLKNRIRRCLHIKSSVPFRYGFRI